MDDLQRVIKLLEEQGKKLSRIEKILESKKNNIASKSIMDKSLTNQSVRKQILDVDGKDKPKYPINRLYQNLFFKTEKTLGEVSENLENDGFNFKSGSIQFALDSADYLNRKGSKRNYSWIQKYPPN